MLIFFFYFGFKVLKGDIRPAIETHEMLYQVIKKHNFLPEVGICLKVHHSLWKICLLCVFDEEFTLPFFYNLAFKFCLFSIVVWVEPQELCRLYLHFCIPLRAKLCITCEIAACETPQRGKYAPCWSISAHEKNTGEKVEAPNYASKPNWALVLLKH